MAYKNIYFDTNALRALGFREYIGPLLSASKEEKLSIFISDPVIWERARQYHQGDEERLIPIGASLTRVVAWYKKLFSAHGATVLVTTEAHKENAYAFVEDDKAYFTEDQKNDLTDALILAIALDRVPVNETIILCGDKKLKKEFERNGYFVRDDAKQCIKELLGSDEGIEISKPDISKMTIDEIRGAINPHLREIIEQSDPDYFADIETELKTLPASADDLIAKLEEMENVDNEARTRIMGYCQWFSPIAKTELSELLTVRGYGVEIIENNSSRLCAEGLLKDTGNNLIPNIGDEDAKQICEQAMVSVMDEIIGLLE